MNAAESLIRTAIAAGVEVCFANPGTTEMPLVLAIDAVPGMRAILGLFEGVCTGAADGYARMAGRPALTLLHMGPGFANGIANLHNARRARSPVVNLIGDHASWHLDADAPLTSDIVSLARPVSSWLRTSRSADLLSQDIADAIAAARRAPGQVASLIVPSDYQSEEVNGPLAAVEVLDTPVIGGRALSEAASALRSEKPAALLLGGQALRERGLVAAARIAEASGCSLLCGTFPARLERGAGLPAVEKLPYFPETALQVLSKFAFLLLTGATEPVAFFGYPGLPSRLTPPSCSAVVLARPEEDVIGALESLAEHLGAPKSPALPGIQRPPRPHRPQGAQVFTQHKNQVQRQIALGAEIRQEIRKAAPCLCRQTGEKLFELSPRRHRGHGDPQKRQGSPRVSVYSVPLW